MHKLLRFIARAIQHGWDALMGALSISAQMGVGLGPRHTGGGTPTPTLAALTAMTFTDPLNRPIEPIIDLGPGPQTGDTINFEYANNYALTGSTLIPVVLTDLMQNVGDALVAALGSIPAGVIYATAWYQHGGAVSYKLPVIAHGDSVAPTVSGTTSGSVAELTPLAVNVTSNKSGVLRLTGTNAGLLEVFGTQPGTAWTVRLVGNANLDYEANPSIAFNAIVQNLSGVDSASLAITRTVTDVDEVIDTPAFGDVTGAAKNTLNTSTNVTIAGLATGVSVPMSWNKEFSLDNGSTWLAANTVVQVSNGTTVKVRLTSANSYLGAVTATGYAGVVALTWQVTTMADPANIVVTYQNFTVNEHGFGSASSVHTVHLKVGVNVIAVMSTNRQVTGLAISGGLTAARVAVSSTNADLTAPLGQVSEWVVVAVTEADYTATASNSASSAFTDVALCARHLAGASSTPAEVDVQASAYNGSSVVIGNGTTLPTGGTIQIAGYATDSAAISWTVGAQVKSAGPTTSGASFSLAALGASGTPAYNVSSGSFPAACATAWGP